MVGVVVGRRGGGAARVGAIIQLVAVGVGVLVAIGGVGVAAGVDARPDRFRRNKREHVVGIFGGIALM